MKLDVTMVESATSGNPAGVAQNCNGPNTWGMWVLLTIVSLGFFGCAEKSDPGPRLIRLAAPLMIESVDSAHPELMDPETAVFKEDSRIAMLDGHANWYPFLVRMELGDNPEETGQSYAIPTPQHGDDGLVIPPQTGIAQIIPVTPGTRLYIEGIGDFDRTKQCIGHFLQLKQCPKLPDEYVPGRLGVWMKELCAGKIRPLVSNEDGTIASRTVNIEPGTRGLLITISSLAQETGSLKELRVHDFSARHDFFLFRQKRRPPALGLAMNPFLGGILRPSLYFPGNTTIRTRMLEIPREALFRFSLGMMGSQEIDVRFEINAISEDGSRQSLYSNRLAGSGEASHLEGWLSDISIGLDSVAGRKAALEFTTECIHGEGGRPQPPPLLFCGAPMICQKNEIENATEGLTNLVLVSLDTLRPDHLGCYGYDRPVSPTIDRLAEQSALFTHAYSQAPYTLPSHTSLFTSLYPSVHGMHFHDFIPAELDLMAEILAGNGMATASFNSSGYLSREFGLQHGFDLYCEVDPIGDRYLDGDPYNPNRLADGSAGSLNEALSWIGLKRKEPFFLFLHTFMIHDYIPPRDLAEQFNEGCKSSLKFGKGSAERLRPENRNDPPISAEEIEYFINMYDASIVAADDMIARLLYCLDEHGLRDNTMIIIFSDHGEEFLEHGGVLHSYTVYEELIRVPLLFHAPGIKQGLRIDSRVNLVDVLPTVLEMFDIDPPAIMQGRSLLSLLEGNAGRDRPIFAETQLPERSRRFCIIQDGWKYIEGSTDETLSFPAPAKEQLFRLEDDPGEHKDLKIEQEKIRNNLKQFMSGLRGDFEQLQEALGTDKGGANEISDELRERLKQQGYL